VKSLLILTMVVALAGCSTLNPYHSEFMCAASENHGKCESVNQAYTEALDKKAAKKQGAVAPAAPAAETTVRAADGTFIKTAQLTGEERYHDAEYRKLAALVEEPVMPIVKQPTVLRTLILSYPAGESLYMPRYVMYFADAPKFVIGEYLNPLSTPKTVFPNGVQ
jgi:conjugal transfer pilus assembly protein TraV